MRTWRAMQALRLASKGPRQEKWKCSCSMNKARCSCSFKGATPGESWKLPKSLMLQRGHARRSVEPGPRERADVRAYVLERGHARRSGETRARRAKTQRLHCFKGATPGEAWKCLLRDREGHHTGGSKGPRQEKRGNRSSKSQSGSRCVCFKGATPGEDAEGGPSASWPTNRLRHRSASRRPRGPLAVIKRRSRLRATPLIARAPARPCSLSI